MAHQKITSTVPRIQYTATALQTVFVIPFRFIADTDIEIYFDTNSTKEDSADYTLSGAGTNANGDVTFDTGVAEDTIVTIVRNSTVERLVDFTTSGTWLADDVNDQLDALTTFIQEVKLKALDLAVTLPITTALTSLEMPDQGTTLNASKIIGWDATGTILSNLSFGDISVAIDVVDASLATNDFLIYNATSVAWENNTPANARTKLGLGTSAVIDTGTSGTKVPLLDGANTWSNRQIWAKGADIASASALTLGTDGNYFDVTGVTGISSITAVAEGMVVKLHFDSVLTLTHSANFVLPGGEDITTDLNDEAEFVQYYSGGWRCTRYTRSSGLPVLGGFVQKVIGTDATASTTTTTMPNDDSLPQNTEGEEVVTVSITPKDTANRLVIIAQVHWSITVTGSVTTALFQDSTADALAVASDYTNQVNVHTTTLRYEMAAGTTSATTFKIRVGNSAAGTTTFNGVGGSRVFGGALISSIEVFEYPT